MADKTKKIAENVPGAFYVDEECTGCGLCESEAPQNFKMNDEGLAFVNKQPANDEEKGQCESALAGCPVEAIGNDGA